MITVQILRRREDQPPLAAAFRQTTRHVQRQRRVLQVIHVRLVQQIHVVSSAFTDEICLPFDGPLVEFLARGRVENVAGQIFVDLFL